MSNCCLWSYYFYLFTQTSSWSLPTLLSLDTTMCLLFYFFTFKPVMLYWMRIKAKLTHIKYSRASFSFYFWIIFVRALQYIFAENDPTTFLRRRRRRKFCGNGAVLNLCEMCTKRKSNHCIEYICIRIWMNTATFLFIMQ